jgi:hypothetical protein
MNRCLPIAEEKGFNSGDKFIDACACDAPFGGECKFRNGELCKKEEKEFIHEYTKDGWKLNRGE